MMKQSVDALQEIDGRCVPSLTASGGLAQEVRCAEEISPATAQRRKGAKRCRVSMGFRCAVREKWGTI
jgi:hypothetical protein